MQNDIVGRGWDFPIRPSSGKGPRYQNGAEKIRQSIEIILSTAPGERRMLPEFGCGIHDLVFEPNTSALRGVVQANVREALTRWEPRIDLLDVWVESPSEQRNYLWIYIGYRIRSNNALYNMVYPFFLREGAGE